MQDNSIDDNEKKIWIEFIRDVKNAQINKINSSSIKMGALITFFVTALVFIINSLPDSKPDCEELLYIANITSFYYSLSITFFNYFNLMFRYNSVNSSMHKKHNKLEKQFLKLYFWTALAVSLVWFLLNIVSLMFINSTSVKYLFNTYAMFIYLVLSIFMSIETLVKVIECTAKEDKYIICRIIIQVTALIAIYILSPLALIYQIGNFYLSGFLFEYKKLFIYSLYFFGLLFSMVYAAKYYSSKIIYTWLEDFYNDIFRYNLSSKMIKERYFEEFTFDHNLELLSYQKTIIPVISTINGLRRWKQRRWWP